MTQPESVMRCQWRQSCLSGAGVLWRNCVAQDFWAQVYSLHHGV